jgi:glutamate dehydrogenase (NAD(P)+)/glutamate dehydrogenase (NADP+)
VVVDNLTLGPAIGGVRLNSDRHRCGGGPLARAMTIKNAAAGLPHGGGKSGIRVIGPPETVDKERIVRAFATRSVTFGYVPGPDMGTDETAMAWIHDEIGPRDRSAQRPRRDPARRDRPRPATGWPSARPRSTRPGGCRWWGPRVAVQGFGAVGSSCRSAAPGSRGPGSRRVRLLRSRLRPGRTERPGARGLHPLHLICEYFDAKPMPRDDLLPSNATCSCRPRRRRHSRRQRRPHSGARRAAGRQSAGHRLRRGHPGPARHPQRARRHPPTRRGVICAAVEYRGGSRTQAFRPISERIRANTAELLDRLSTRDDLLPSQAAVMMARTRLDAASAYRRRF